MKKIFQLALFSATFFTSTIQANSFLIAAPKDTGNPFAVLMFIAALLYFIPSVIGILRKHHNLIGLMALNILLGWTVIGWVGALIWSLLRSNKGQTIIVHGKSDDRQESKYEMLERLNSLKNSGAISEEEYDIEKSQLLSKH